MKHPQHDRHKNTRNAYLHAKKKKKNEKCCKNYYYTALGAKNSTSLHKFLSGLTANLRNSKLAIHTYNFSAIHDKLMRHSTFECKQRNCTPLGKSVPYQQTTYTKCQTYLPPLSPVCFRSKQWTSVAHNKSARNECTSQNSVYLLLQNNKTAEIGAEATIVNVGHVMYNTKAPGLAKVVQPSSHIEP